MNLAELKKRTVGNDLLDIIEVLINKNDILSDLEYEAANNGGSHIYNRRAVNGAGSWRGINEGVAPTSSQTSLHEESLGIYENVASFDAHLLNLVNAAQLRDQEVNNKIEDVGDQIADAVFYGTGTDKKPLGLINREEYSSLSSSQVVSADGTGSNISSIFVVTNDIRNGLFVAHAPQGAAGIVVDDIGIVSEGTTTKRRVQDIYVTWNGAVCVSHPLNIARVANVQTDSTSDSYWKSVNLSIIDALAKIKSPIAGKTVIYVNRDVQAVMDKAAFVQGNMYWTPGAQGFGGQVVATFKGYPVKVCDAISSTEDSVIA